MDKQISAYFMLPLSPETAVKAVFTETEADDLVSEVESWMPVAFSNEMGCYEDANERERLIMLLKDLKELIEVMSPPYFLNRKEFAITSKEFSQKYELPYLRQELFDFFLSVATYQGPIEVHRGCVGVYYLYFTTLAECALLLNQPK